ncbi:SymE family type I addiction module toxin [Agaribacillus aureus]|uniref:SymE family type I addiction module toxin n=1 Tax=Agaribacillus aureus TaxID=3051825 RepID=UPI003D1FC5C8
MKNFRKLKIYPKSQNRTYDSVTFPEIRLTGKWLKELGFREGQEILIEQQQNKLIITHDNKNH